MEITIGEELIEIQPQVFISIFCSFITAIIPLLAVRYLSLRERNNYIKLLDKHFPLINEFLREIRSYKMLTSLFAFAGLYLGALVSFVFLVGALDFFDFILNTSWSNIFSLDFFMKFIPVMVNIGYCISVMRFYLFFSCEAFQFSLLDILYFFFEPEDFIDEELCPICSLDIILALLNFYPQFFNFYSALIDFLQRLLHFLLEFY